jgi:ankyrin repeat protein
MKRILVLAITLFLTLGIAQTIAGQDVNEGVQARDSLFDAIESGDRREVLKILNNPQHIDLNYRDPADGRTFLIEAIRAEQPQIVRILLERGADPNLKELIAASDAVDANQGATPLDAALETNETEMVDLLIQHGLNLQQHPSALHSSTSTKMLRFLLDHGALIDGRDENGETYLQTAIDNDEEEIVELLIERGANVNVADEEGVTPLMRVESIEDARLLLEHGANVNATDNEGQTALHLLTSEPGRIEFATLLITRGADVNARDHDGHTPLDYVIEAFDYDFALLLVSHGARVNEEMVRQYGLVEEFEKIRRGEKPGVAG